MIWERTSEQWWCCDDASATTTQRYKITSFFFIKCTLLFYYVATFSNIFLPIENTLFIIYLLDREIYLSTVFVLLAYSSFVPLQYDLWQSYLLLYDYMNSIEDILQWTIWLNFSHWRAFNSIHIGRVTTGYDSSDRVTRDQRLSLRTMSDRRIPHISILFIPQNKHDGPDDKYNYDKNIIYPQRQIA